MTTLPTDEPATEARVLDPVSWMSALSANALRLSMDVRGFSSFPPESQWGFANRTVPLHVMYLVAQGGIRISWADTAIAVQPGEFFWVAPNVRHSLRPVSVRTTLTAYHMRMDAVLDGRPCRLAHDVVHVAGRPQIQSAVEQCYDAHLESGPFTMEHRHGAFLILFSRVLSGSTISQRHHVFSPGQRRLLQDHLDSNPRAKPSPDSLAALLALSPDYFARRFRNTFGVSPRVWLAQERVVPGVR